MSSASRLWKSSFGGVLWPIPETGKNRREPANRNMSQALSWLLDRAAKSKVFYVEHFSVLRKGCPAKIFFGRVVCEHRNVPDRD